MTLQELRYVVTVARERHFSRAARLCFVSQPALSAAIRKLEDELGLQIFDRSTPEVTVTPLGREVVAQAQRVLDAAAAVTTVAQAARDPFASPFSLGLIHTICPWLLPPWVPAIHAEAPHLPLHLQEGLTAELVEKLHAGELDAAVVAAPFAEPGLESRPVYEEPLVAVAPLGHIWAAANHVTPAMLAAETVLLLTPGNCFRDQVLHACPDLQREGQGLSAMARTLRGSSLTTIRHMVLSGVGVTVLPATAVSAQDAQVLVIRPLVPEDRRQVLLVWRRHAARAPVLDLLTRTIQRIVREGRLPGALPVG